MAAITEICLNRSAWR